MFRRGGYGGRSKAPPDTTCQKCLKKGHYSYECTVPAQERPYKSRPSRTQQLLNPSLKPKLSEHVPNELVRKKGLADKILAENEEERRKKSGRRARSASSTSDSGSSGPQYATEVELNEPRGERTAKVKIPFKSHGYIPR
ncbi:hypothetical protein N0V90_007944 [Kalmusia sp. IMI 367209]|nr:hypothetical protein N0V90_007944 [Kalmusia sp. IMI 367209]